MSIITNAPLPGINVRDGKDISYAELICKGLKKVETRNSNSLKPYIGQRVRIVRTSTKNKKAQIIGEVTIGTPIIYSCENEFLTNYNLHLIDRSSEFWIQPDEVKYGYPIEKPTLYNSPYPPTSRGLIARTNQPQPAKIISIKKAQSMWCAFDKEEELLALSTTKKLLKDFFMGRCYKANNGYVIIHERKEIYIFNSIYEAIKSGILLNPENILEKTQYILT